MSEAEREMARAAQRCLMEAIDHSRAAAIALHSQDGQGPVVDLPPQALRLIAQVLGALSERRSVVVMPAGREFSTVEAANFLNVSRPFLIKELEAGRLPFRMVGTHRRIAFEDLAAYAEAMRAGQQSALDSMAENARDLGLDY
jgi:excisionase family DNA binding protein